MAKIASLIRRFISMCRTQGVALALKQGLHSVLVKPVRCRRLYQRFSALYPVNLIFIAGYAKSGSSWFAHMLAELDGFSEITPLGWREINVSGHDACHIYPGFVQEFSGKLAVVKGHTWGNEGNVAALQEQGVQKYIVTVRDPRDALISAYWYIRKRPAHWDYEKVSSMTLEEFVSFKIRSGEFEQQFVEWLRVWIRNRGSGCLLVRYEDLLADADRELVRALEHLGFDIPAERVRTIVDKHDFSKVAGRNRGVEDTSKFARKGVSGEWATVFTKEQKQDSSRIASDVLELLNYPVE